MPFDPTKPVENSPLDAAEMRNQLNGLKDIIDTKPDLGAVNDAISTNSAKNVDSMDTLDLAINDPPTQAQVQAIEDKLNELIAALQH